MPRVIVQTDDGATVQTLEYSIESIYALYLMPSVPTHTGLHTLLRGLKRALEDAATVQEGGDPRYLSERVMDRISRSDEDNQ